MQEQVPLGPKDLVCPFHNKYMNKVCHKCPLWIHIRGKHPQSEQEVDKWGCAIGFMPMLTIESAQMGRQTGAAVESLRNEIIKRSKIPLEPDDKPPIELFGKPTNLLR